MLGCCGQGTAKRFTALDRSGVPGTSCCRFQGRMHPIEGVSPLRRDTETPARRCFVYAAPAVNVAAGDEKGMHSKRVFVCLLFSIAVITIVGCNSTPNVSGVWQGTLQATDKRGHQWQGPAELTLNQNGNALTGTLAFTHPQGGRVQVPVSSGIVSKDSVTFSGQNQFPMGSLEISFHGKATGTTLTGTADMTSRSLLLGPETDPGTLSLQKQ